MYFSLPSPIDYVKKVNEQFIESGKLINSEKEAEKFKIINPEIRDSYKVNKNIKVWQKFPVFVINMKFHLLFLVMFALIIPKNLPIF